MKIQFDPNLDFQHEAINAVVDLFDGQEVCRTNFTVAPLKYDPQFTFEFENKQNDLGIGNRPQPIRYHKTGWQNLIDGIPKIFLAGICNFCQ